MACKPKPTGHETCTPDSCTGCGSGSLSTTKTLKRNIAEVSCTVKIVTASSSMNTRRCRSCGRDGMEPETGLPNGGSHDLSITAEVADDYECRMPFGMIADCMVRHGITPSSGTARNTMRRLGAPLETHAADIAA